MIDRETSPSVMLVDFDDQCRRLAGRALRDAGWRVIEARTSAFAVALMDGAEGAAAPVDLLVVDPATSGMGIDEIGRQIRACQPDLKILYVTRSVDKLFEARGALWTGEAYLAKPFTAKGLVEAVSLLMYGCLNREDVAALGSGARLNAGVGANRRWSRLLAESRRLVRGLEPRRFLSIGLHGRHRNESGSAADTTCPQRQLQRPTLTRPTRDHAQSPTIASSWRGRPQPSTIAGSWPGRPHHLVLVSSRAD